MGEITPKLVDCMLHSSFLFFVLRGWDWCYGEMFRLLVMMVRRIFSKGWGEERWGEWFEIGANLTLHVVRVRWENARYGINIGEG